MRFHVLEYAARSRPTLGDALSCIARYYRLMHAAAEFMLIEEGERVVYRYRVTDGVHQPPAANDFVLGSTLSFVRRNTRGVDALEVHFAHPEPPYVEVYRQYFSCPISFGGGMNEIVFHKDTLAAPMARSDATVSEAYEQHANVCSNGCLRWRASPGASGASSSSSCAAERSRWSSWRGAWP